MLEVTVGCVTLVRMVDPESIYERSGKILVRSGEVLEFALPGGGFIASKSESAEDNAAARDAAIKIASKINSQIRNGAGPRIVATEDGRPYTRSVAIELMTRDRRNAE